MGRKKVVVEGGEITVKEFETLPEATGGRTKKVDYDQLVDKLAGRVLSIKGVAQEMKNCSNGLKTKVYYSEVLGAIDRLKESGRLDFQRRQGDVIMYHFTIPEPETQETEE